MTNSEFAGWRARHFRSLSAAGRALGLDRETVQALEWGKTRNGTAWPVPVHIELAAAAWTMGIRAYAGGAVTLGAVE